MALAFVWVAMLTGLFVVEKNHARFFFPVASLLFVASAFVVLVGDPLQASLLAAMFAATVTIASRAKQRLTGSSLKASDFTLLLYSEPAFLLRAYRREFAAAVIAAILIVAAIVAIVLGLDRKPLGSAIRLGAFVAAAAALVGAYELAGGEQRLYASVTRDSRPFSTFVASCLDIYRRGWSGWMPMTDVADVALALPAIQAAPPSVRPDIIVIQHESTFDPRIYGLPIGPEVAAFLTPPGPLAGRLHVDCFGGASWKSEFAFLTGISALAFGPDNWRVFQQGGGRFRHTLPLWLRALGYRTAMASTSRSGYLNSDAFYRLAGMDRRLFVDDLFQPSARKIFEVREHDGEFFKAAMDAFDAGIDEQPRFVMLLTDYNHASHLKQTAPPAREVDRKFAVAACPLAEYGEYYARLVETAACYAELKRHLTERFPERPTVFVHYGDHQPALAAQLIERGGFESDDRRRFETFYAIEAVNFDLSPPSMPVSDPLDIAFLGTLLLDAARLPLDAVFRARLALMAECGSAYFASRSPMKAGLHRALLDAGLVKLA